MSAFIDSIWSELHDKPVVISSIPALPTGEKLVSVESALGAGQDLSMRNPKFVELSPPFSHPYLDKNLKLS